MTEEKSWLGVSPSVVRIPFDGLSERLWLLDFFVSRLDQIDKLVVLFLI